MEAANAAFDLAVQRVELPVPSGREVARRLRQGLRAAARHMPSLARRRGRPDVLRALRLTFEEMGGTFIKFGQLLGSAPSLFGEDTAHEFRSFLDAGPPADRAAVAARIEEQLGRPAGEVFAFFDPEPLASASLAVVHRARLRDGTDVAVKVLRPGIEQQIAVDLAILRPLFTFVARQVAVGIAVTLPGVVTGLRDQVREELDLTNEARAMRWFADLRDVMGLRTVTVPVPFEHLSGQRVLTMEFLDGVPIDDLAAVEALDIDAPALVRDTIAAWFASAVCTGRFHGDIHAGNLLITPDGRLAVLDWGIVGRLDEETHRFFRSCIEGVLGDDSAWETVTTHILQAYGDGIQDALGLSDPDMVRFVRAQVEPLFREPFGQVDLRQMMGPPAQDAGGRAVTPARTRRQQLAFWRAERSRVRRLMAMDGYHGDFDRATFLLSKQLVYFDRYGKQYLPDTPLLFDEQVYRSLLEWRPPARAGEALA